MKFLKFTFVLVIYLAASLCLISEPLLYYAGGFNVLGQLGNGNNTPTSFFVKVGNDADWGTISSNNAHSLAIRSGKLYTWGHNSFGQLGDGTTNNKNVPTQIGNDSDWEFVASGYNHSLGIKGGKLYAWGRNNFGQLGDGTLINKEVPTQIGSDSDWEFVACGYYHSLGIKGGKLYTWGYNYWGQLGDGTTNDKEVPTQIGSDSDWEFVTAGNRNSLAMKGGSKLYSWGDNSMGQIGDGTLIGKLVPTQIGSDTDWEKISTGRFHNLAIKAGKLYAWGYNELGQLGDGTTNNKNVPTRIGSDTDWGNIGTGLYHSIGIRSGLLFTWGRNEGGELGDGTTIQKNSPTQIGSDTDWNSADGGEGFTVLTKTLSLEPEVWVNASFNDQTTGWGVTHFNNLSTALIKVTSTGTVNISNYAYTGDVDMTGRTFIVGTQDFELTGNLSGGQIRVINTGALLIKDLSSSVTKTFPITDGTYNYTMTVNTDVNSNPDISVRISSPNPSGKINADFWEIDGPANLNATLTLRVDKVAIAPKTLTNNTQVRYFDSVNNRYIVVNGNNFSIEEFDTYYILTLTGVNQF